MHNGKDNPLRLMIVDDSGEDAEAIVSSLRNSGIAVRPSRPQHADELDAMLATQQIDLVLSAHAQAIPLTQVLQRVATSGKDIPVIMLSERIDEDVWSGALSSGARAIALRQRPEQLLMVMRTTWADLQARRGLRRIEAQMRETERRCDALIASSRDPIAYIHEGMHIRANDAYLEMFGFTSFEEVEGISLLDMLAPQHVEDFKQLLKSLSKGEPPPAQYQVDARTLEGESFPATMEFATASYEGEACVQVVFRRREELDPELAREVEGLRQRDQVTGLLNRPTFMLALENAVAQVGRGDGQFGFLLVEPDHYKRLVTDIGLDSADVLIAALAKHLAAAIDSDVQAARFGEHNFALLLKGDYARTSTLAQRLLHTYASQVLSVGERSATVTVSIGGVQIGEKIASVGQVLARASENVQTNIELGGNACKIFDPGAADRLEEERIQRWVQHLHEALADGGFLLHYQPLVNLQGEPHELYGAYLRLELNNELIRPGTFLGIATEYGMMAEIDRWVVSRAIAVIGERQRAGHTTSVLVKITTDSFADAQMVQLIQRELAKHSVPGARLWLQTPEAKVFTHLRNAQQFLADATALGCKVGLEQFGSGLDSFQLLAHFQPAFLKLDRDFTRDLTQTREQQDKIHEITARAQSAGIRTIAEFVSDATSMSLLFNAGIDYMQGEFVGLATGEMNFDFN
ncbi:EAL domain-containing protein [Xanthomonas albilineans]|uniref:Uncharacterized protein n=1 Tax=Xanthomonas albilineans (strain GPE PC73 / CFBP 7063) TaxID=380358 RepID=D2UCT9_XANAP|nr:EAL domain-containing protein [Xanthomonas albilineans]QHQ27832.1 hypothetical protein XaFJ1_GM001085 [Xanthomonas albilineans]CBA15616.1 hypothetical protein XALC_1101 [Xanthomonas albilineans GPE PC73]